jgi:uncharacterized repeat protein (TIGR01451 family)
VVTVDTDASSITGVAAAATDQVIATYTSSSATLTKYVRNVTSANGTAGLMRSFTVNGSTNDYFTGGVTGASGETLEYLLLVDNTSTAAVTACTIDDVLPTEFVTLAADAYGGADEVTYVDELGAETQLSQDADTDAATVTGANLTVHVGSGATDALGGTVSAGTSVFIVYQVTINN